MVVNVFTNSLQAFAFGTFREGGASIDGASAEVVGPESAYGIEPFERQSERVEPGMAGGATRVGPMSLQHLA